MVDDLIENIEAYLRLNTLGDMSDGVTINCIQMSLRNYRKAKKLSVQEEIESRNAMTTYYGGTNPLD